MAQYRYGDFADFAGSYEEWLRFILDNLQEAEYRELKRSVQARLDDVREQWEQNEIPPPAEADTPFPVPVYSVAGDKLVVRLRWPDGRLTKGFSNAPRR